MTKVSEIEAKMKFVATQIADCNDPVIRAKLETHFSRLMTELRKRKRMRTQKAIGHASATRGPGTGQKPQKRVDLLVRAKRQVGFWGTKTHFVRGGSMSKK